MAYITVGFSSHIILEYLSENGLLGLDEISPSHIPDATKVLVNGAWIGIHYNPDELVRVVRELRRNGSLPAEVGVIWDMRDRELQFFSDPGRICRPLLIVDDGYKVRLKPEHVERLVRDRELRLTRHTGHP